MADARTEYSRLGMASFAVSLIPGALLAAFVLLARLLSTAAPSQADEAGFAAAFVFVLLTLLSEVLALGLGVAGALQRRRRRLFAFLGVACSVLVLVAVFAHRAIFPA